MNMKISKNILVLTDFSDVCLNAVHYGAEFARFLGCPLTIAHIIDRKSIDELKKENLTISAINKRIEDIADKTRKKYGIEVSGISRKGSIYKTTGEIATEISAGFVVLGTHGMVGIKQKLSGSYAKKVVTSCPVPVIIVQKGINFGQGFKNIVFPVSTTAEVRQKVALTTFLSKTFKSKIHIFQLLEQAEESQIKMDKILSQITNEFDNNRIPYTTASARKLAHFGEQVLDYAKENKADMITIMTTPSSMNFVFNRYTEKMIHNEYGIPVMCVNPVKTWQETWK
jgi:nucleotide-binding universal stress UspA family protein